MTKNKFTKRDVEATLAFQLRAFKIDHKTQYRFHPTRKWRFDFAFPAHCLAVEVQGITGINFSKRGKAFVGGHQSPQGVKRDLEKFDEAMRLGWKIYCCEQEMVDTGRALKTIQILLGLIEVQDVKQKALAL